MVSNKADRQTRGIKMKKVTMYEIREYKDAQSYSRSISRKLRTRVSAMKLVKRLKASGMKDVFASKMVIQA